MPSSHPTSPSSSSTMRWLPWAIVAVVAALFVWQQVKLGGLSDEVAALQAAPAAKAPTGSRSASSLKERVSMDLIGDVERRLGVVEQRLKGLDGRVRRAEKMGRGRGKLGANPTEAMALVLGADDDATPDEVAALREDVDALLTGEGMNAPEAKAVIESMIEKRENKRRAKWRKVGDEAAKEWLKEVSTELELDDDTTAALDGLLTTRRETRWEMYQKVRDDEMTYAEARKAMEDVRTASKEEIKTLLGDEKYDVFVAKEEERRSNRRRGL